MSWPAEATTTCEPAVDRFRVHADVNDDIRPRRTAAARHRLGAMNDSDD